ncbi:response regulator receiver domain-containing protein [Thermosporothrix hazakensis]|jgi:CheY-like chemotaxis protein|uniref:Response regulator receiver domain-containing protein n=1 Tax=Thermosporothrix hazakensis TaxID=644383 RepID=A0A326U161_THEHA|nr:response regulator [Thermosporothrix hazakensis]PZW23524.1 response regulator receiver domain-containing protein [Thermosporothrix hazakensis]GCE51108.1 response regulator [Thermosporothrix hazakensis]
MEETKKSIVILMADDDEDDVMLTEKALRKGKLLNTLQSVRDGEELLDYLLRRGKYSDPDSSPRPGLILLDLNMPRKDGREALREIKSHDDLKNIPVVVFTTSKAEEDIYRSYRLGVNSFITKPVTFEKLIDVMQMLGKYWFEVVTLPQEEKYGKTTDKAASD